MVSNYDLLKCIPLSKPVYEYMSRTRQSLIRLGIGNGVTESENFPEKVRKIVKFIAQ